MKGTKKRMMADQLEDAVKQGVLGERGWRRIAAEKREWIRKLKKAKVRLEQERRRRRIEV